MDVKDNIFISDKAYCNELAKLITIHNGIHNKNSLTLNKNIKSIDINLRKTKTPDVIHFIWIGDLSDLNYRYIDIWSKCNKDKKIIIWIDPNSVFCKKLYNHLESYARRYHSENFEATMVNLQNAAYFYIMQRIDKNEKNLTLIDFLYENEIITKKVREQYIKDFKSLTIHNKKYKHNNINDLFSGIGAGYKKYYHYELYLRGILSCASDIIRILILYIHGGIYIDVDTLPYVNYIFKKTNDILLANNLENDEFLALIKTECILSKINGDKNTGVALYKRITEIENLKVQLKNKIVDAIFYDLRFFNLKQIRPLGEIFVYRNFPSLSSIKCLKGVFYNNVICSCAEAKSLKIVLRCIKKRYTFIENNFAIMDFNNKSDIKSYYSRLLEYRNDIFKKYDFVTLSLTGPRVISEVLLALSYKVLDLDDEISPYVISVVMQNDTYGIAFFAQNMDTPLGIN